MTEGKVMYSLVADIGGTNARLQLIKFHEEDPIPSEVKAFFYQTKDFVNFSACLNEFLKEFKDTEKWPHNATCAVAGAPFNNKLGMVNCSWKEIDGNAMAEEFNIRPFRLINDFEAIGYSLLKIPKENLVQLNDAPKIEAKPMACAGSGTGLGEVVLNPGIQADGSTKYYVCPTEGGHKDFACTERIDIEYLEFCMENVPEVKEMNYLSVERAFCGPAIPTMYKFFCKREGVEPKDVTSKDIFQDGLKKADPICVKVLEFYARLYGKEISNFACDTLPYSGIYLVGGMINSVRDYFIKDESCPFLKSYFSKDKITNNVLAKFPIYIVTYDELGLLGAFVKAQIDAFGHDQAHTNLKKY